MRAAIVPSLIIAAGLALAGCGGSASRDAAAPAGAVAKPGSFSEGGTLVPYYGEELHDGRIYVFGTRIAHEQFKQSHEPNVLNSKTLIKVGPNRETVILQTDKDVPVMTERILRVFRERYHLAA